MDRLHYIELWKHYFSATKSNYKTYIQGEKDTSAKRNLFILRNILCGEYIKHEHEFPIIQFQTLLDNAPPETFEYISKQEFENLAQMKINKQGDTDIGNTYQEGIEEFLNQDFEYQDHIPEKTIQSEDLDEYMKRLIQSTTLFL